MSQHPGLQRVEQWFADRGIEPFAFQRETWNAYLQGQSGLIQAPTGMGKTLAAALGPMMNSSVTRASGPCMKRSARARGPCHGDALHMLWITPLRALAADTVEALTGAVEALKLPWTVELRTSDTRQSVRKRQKERLPTVLVTTPESMSLLLSYPDSPGRFDTLSAIVVDEWHELMGNKRGVQAELALARLRKLQPDLRIWGLSATMANIEEAIAALVGPARAPSARIIRAPDRKAIVLDSIIPPNIERFPWAGHLGVRMVEPVVKQIESAGTTLVFTNTRSQAELWFRALLQARPDWIGKIAVHHGSIDRDLRTRIEQMLRTGTLKAAVCTSSLDLGVDFWPVDQVLQIGSPKSIARTIQRAGRSGHRPGAESRIVCVPTQALEILEYSAARHAIAQRDIEPREPVTMALDVLAQHVITVAAGGGFDSQQLLAEIRDTHAYNQITDEQWQWVMDFAERGGPTLTAYPRFARIRRDETGRWNIVSDPFARMHRMSIGTITADGSVNVQFVGGKRLGSVEESFVAKMRPGDVFIFAGRNLEFVRIHDMTAHVRPARKKRGGVPRWMGGRLPMSSSLAEAVRLRLEEADDGIFLDEEMRHIRPILELQSRWSHIPRRNEILIESTKTREGHHHFLFLFQGRLVHEGLSALLAYRLHRHSSAPITATINDHGVEIHSPIPLPMDEPAWREVLSTENLMDDVLACINSGELAKRHFREIARIAGLLIPTRPGAPRSVRQLQASSSLFYDVFKEFDPGNLLLDQARREVLERQLEFARMRRALERVHSEKIVTVTTERLSPLAFPLWAELIGSQRLRMEGSHDRIERIARQLEEAADQEAAKLEKLAASR